jgi:hypothetical protein
VFSACAYAWFEVFQRKADFSHRLLTDARAEHQKILEAQQQAQAQDHARAARKAALAQLDVHGKYGQRQLLTIDARVLGDSSNCSHRTFGNDFWFCIKCEPPDNPAREGLCCV